MGNTAGAQKMGPEAIGATAYTLVKTTSVCTVGWIENTTQRTHDGAQCMLGAHQALFPWASWLPPLCWLPAYLGLCPLQCLLPFGFVPVWPLSPLGSCEETWVDSAIHFQFCAAYLWKVHPGW